MNLRVDLLLDTERRSASLLNLRSIARIAAIVVPCILLVVISAFVVQVLALKGKRNTLTSMWSYQSPKLDKATEIKACLATNAQILAEIKGWLGARISWHEHLRDLQQGIPPQVELRRMILGHNLLIHDRKYTARAYTLSMTGRSVGAGSEDCVQNVKQKLSSQPVFTNCLEDVTVPEFRADPTPGASRADRIFTLDCSYRKLVFVPPKEAGKTRSQ